MYKALILDMDGTMLDTERHLIALWDAAAREAGHIFAMEDMCATVGVTGPQSRAHMHARYPDAPHEQIGKVVHQRFGEMRARGEVPAKPGLMELLEYARGIGLPIAVCTSTSEVSARPSLDAAGATPYLSAVVFGGEAEQGKPHPAPYLLAASRLGVAPEDCLAVEDSPPGARSAIGAGMTVLVVPDLIPVPQDVREKARVVETLHDVVAALRGGETTKASGGLRD